MLISMTFLRAAQILLHRTSINSVVTQDAPHFSARGPKTHQTIALAEPSRREKRSYFKRRALA
jgi:hypothetical protein